MRIKVGDIWYDGREQPIMVELTDADKRNIRDMPKSNHRYCVYPDTFSPKKIEEWMKL